MSGTTVQQNVAQYLKELADKVEKSRYCTASVNETPEYVEVSRNGVTFSRYKTGEREITLKLNYIEERL